MPQLLNAFLAIMVLTNQGCCSRRITKCDSALCSSDTYFGDQPIFTEVKTISDSTVSCMAGTTLCAQIGNLYNLSVKTSTDMVVYAFLLDKGPSEETGGCGLALSNISYFGTAILNGTAQQKLSKTAGTPSQLEVSESRSRTYEEMYLVGLHPEFHKQLKNRPSMEETTLIRDLQLNVCSRLPGCDPGKDPPPIKDASGKSEGQVMRFQRVAILRFQ